MRKIKLFEQFVNERMGVPDAILRMVDPITDLAMKTVKRVFDNADLVGVRDNFETVYEPENVDPEFPVHKYELDCAFEVGGGMTAFYVNGGTGKMSTDAEGKLTVNISVTVNVNMGVVIANIGNPEMTKTIREEMRSTVEHELLHIYETYKRRAGRRKELLATTSADFAHTAALISHLDIPQSAASLFHLIYVQAPHEIAARVPQVQSLIRNIPEGHYRIKTIKESTPYQEALAMMEFDAQKFHDGIVNLLVKSKREEGDRHYTKMSAKADLDHFFAELEKNFKRGNEQLKSVVAELVDQELVGPVTKELEKHSELFDRQEKMTAMQFLKYWEKKLHYAGKKLHDKLIKLTTY